MSSQHSFVDCGSRVRLEGMYENDKKKCLRRAAGRKPRGGVFDSSRDRSASFAIVVLCSIRRKYMLLKVLTRSVADKGRRGSQCDKLSNVHTLPKGVSAVAEWIVSSPCRFGVNLSSPIFLTAAE